MNDKGLTRILTNMMMIAGLTGDISDLVLKMEPETVRGIRLSAAIMAYVYAIEPATEIVRKIILPMTEDSSIDEQEIKDVLEWMEQDHGQRSDGDA
jgi:hypothetical protein